jgi:hypothetical protein
MPAPPQSPTDLAHLIQLSVAPVFLLTGAGTLLNVLSARLGRVVDRSRVLNEKLKEGAEKGVREEFHVLQHRRRLVNLAILSTGAAALTVCILIGSMFLGFLLDLRVSILIAALFVIAMLGFISGLVLFLREALLASGSVHLDVR